MHIQFFNFWYFFFLILSAGGFTGLYFMLKNKRPLTIKIVLVSLCVFALVLHFLKGLYPPYSLNYEIHLRDSWFINICGANIAIFPILLLTKNNRLKDYMFYLGVISGMLAVALPLDPMGKANQAAEWIDIIRFYIHHSLLWYVPLLMVLLKVHKLDYRRIWSVPVIFMGVLGFIMLNQVLQYELGFITYERTSIFEIPYINNSLIWGPNGEGDTIGKIASFLCPKIFKTIPVGEHAGEAKHWPWFWLIVPSFIVLIPICFGISMIFEHQHFKNDMIKLFNKCKKLKRRGNK